MRLNEETAEQPEGEITTFRARMTDTVLKRPLDSGILGRRWATAAHKGEGTMPRGLGGCLHGHGGCEGWERLRGQAQQGREVGELCAPHLKAGRNPLQKRKTVQQGGHEGPKPSGSPGPHALACSYMNKSAIVSEATLLLFSWSPSSHKSAHPNQAGLGRTERPVSAHPSCVPHPGKPTYGNAQAGRRLHTGVTHPQPQVNFSLKNESHPGPVMQMSQQRLLAQHMSLHQGLGYMDDSD